MWRQKGREVLFISSTRPSEKKITGFKSFDIFLFLGRAHLFDFHFIAHYLTLNLSLFIEHGYANEIIDHKNSACVRYSNISPFYNLTETSSHFLSLTFITHYRIVAWEWKKLLVSLILLRGYFGILIVVE